MSLAAPVFAGCATSGGPPPVQQPAAQQQLAEAQAESEAAYQRAQDAQEHARDVSQRAAKAEQEALRKQQAAQDAEQRAQVLRQQAQEAQREAMQLGQQAAHEALQAQQRAIRDQPQAQAQLQAMGATTQTVGTIRSSSADELVIARDNAPQLHLQVNPGQLVVERDGQQVSLGDLAPGTRVRVSYRMVRDQPVAQSVVTTQQTANREDKPGENQPQQPEPAQQPQQIH